MKIKTGKCIDCIDSTQDVPLIADRCQHHYWKERARVNAEKGKNRQKTAQKNVVGVFMGSQVLNMPKYCEESGQLLPRNPKWLMLSCCAHILPKREGFGGFPSVATHPMNMIYLHPDIHTNMDNLGWEYIQKMKTLEVMKKRVAVLLPFLTEQELNRVPQYFL